MSATIQRSLFTNRLLELLALSKAPDGSPIPCGDMELPAGNGWQGGGPNTPGAHFVPYRILTPLQATPNSQGQSFAHPQRDWLLPYSLQHYGVSREHTEYIGDLGRAALAGLLNDELDLGDAIYKVQQINTDLIGAVQRVPGTDPAYFGQGDQFTVWVTRQRSNA